MPTVNQPGICLRENSQFPTRDSLRADDGSHVRQQRVLPWITNPLNRAALDVYDVHCGPVQLKRVRHH